MLNIRKGNVNSKGAPSKEGGPGTTQAQMIGTFYSHDCAYVGVQYVLFGVENNAEGVSSGIYRR